MKMKRLAAAIGAAAVLLCPSIKAEDGYMVFGDSQSFVVQDTGDASKNWPHLLQEFTGRHFLNLSRGGRRLSDNHAAEYLRMANVHRLNQQAKAVIIAMGSLDARVGLDPTEAIIDVVTEAEARGMRVVCLLPPNNAFWETAYMRDIIRNVCPASIDMSEHVGPEMMVDGVHFGEEGHSYYARAVFWGLVLGGLY